MHKDKENNILNILSALESVFTGVYLHYDDKPESRKNKTEKAKI